MHRHYVRSRPEGRQHRTKLRVLVLPTLRVGQPVPTSTFLGHWLRLNPSEAWRHMRRVLAEDGYVTATHGGGRAKRVYVVEIPAMRAAA